MGITVHNINICGYSHYQRMVYPSENQEYLIDWQIHKDVVILIYWHKTVAVLHQQTQALKGGGKTYYTYLIDS